MEPGHVKRHRIDVGNTKDVIEWGTEHRSKRIQPMEPWFYSKKSSTALHLFKFDSQASISHRYEFDLQIVNLICMQQMINGEWTDLKKPKMDVFHTKKTKKINIPAIIGMFGNVRENEIDFHYCDKTYDTYYIEDVGIIDDKNNVKYGSTPSVEIATNAIIKAVHWCAENMTAADFNNRCNFTTNRKNSKIGVNPIDTNDLNYANSSKFTDIPSSHLEGPLVRKHFTTASNRVGINSFSYVYSHGGVGIDVGLSTKATLSCKIKTNDESASKDDEFRLRCRVLLLREMTIADGMINFHREKSTH
jgi:hypothetical protein